MKVGYKDIEDINTPKGRKKFLKGKKIMFACCFCPNGIEDPEKEVVMKLWNTNQIFWCHKECLKSKMTKQARSEFQNSKKGIEWA